jgi:hypothetical protein
MYARVKGSLSSSKSERIEDDDEDEENKRGQRVFDLHTAGIFLRVLADKCMMSVA